MTTGYVNDREATHAEGDVLIEIETFIIRAAMNDCFVHCARDALVSKLL